MGLLHITNRKGWKGVNFLLQVFNQLVSHITVTPLIIIIWEKKLNVWNKEVCLAFFLCFEAFIVLKSSACRADVTACLLLCRISSRWRSNNNSPAVGGKKLKPVAIRVLC